MELMANTAGKTITSKELVDQINMFREKGSAELQHKTLLAIIREEFDEEITEQKILLSEYRDSTGRSLPMFNLTISQAKQVLVRESKVVRKAVIKLLDELESKGLSPVIVDKTTNAMDQWGKQSSTLLSIVGDLCSDDMKRRFVLETGIRIEIEHHVSIVPESMERAFALGSDVVQSEAVAKVMAGGQTMIVRDIAAKLGVGIQRINAALTELGYQTVHFSKGKSGRYYVPTKLGEKCCVISEHETKRGSGPIRYRKITGWYIEYIFDILENYFKKTITK